MKTIYLDSKDVPTQLRGAYTGKQFKVVISKEIEIPMTAGLWDGGSREQYSLVEIATGRSVPTPAQSTAPWSNDRHEYRGELPEGVAMVVHSMFCGKDMGLTFYIHPDNAVKLLPQKAELTETQESVLRATRSLKSSYAGKDRYENARDYPAGIGIKQNPFPSREEWEAAKLELISNGYLNKAGAITTKGRNAI